MQRLEVNCAVRPLKWSLGVKWLTLSLDGVCGQRHGPAALPPVETRYQLHRRLGVPPGRSGQVRKISPPPPGFDPRTIQPVASRYTD